MIIKRKSDFRWRRSFAFFPIRIGNGASDVSHYIWFQFYEWRWQQISRLEEAVTMTLPYQIRMSDGKMFDAYIDND